jgi:single-strand DNA-binding protein
MNKVILIGNVGSDIDLKYTQSGKAVCNFSLATNDRKDYTEWHSIDAWEKTAELISKYVVKGSKICVEGRIQTRSYNDRDGNKRYKTSIICERVEFLSSKNDSADKSAGNTGNTNQVNSGQTFNEDDIPF